MWAKGAAEDLLLPAAAAAPGNTTTTTTTTGTDKNGGRGKVEKDIIQLYKGSGISTLGLVLAIPDQ